MTIALVSMPWNLHALTSAQIGGLKSWLVSRGHKAVGRHYHKDVLNVFNADDVSLIHEFGVGEHVFGAVRFPERRDLFEQAIRERAPGLNVKAVIDAAMRFVAAAVDDLLEIEDLELLGFTTTHVQVAASLCVAREVRARRPGVVTILGGLHLDHRFGAGLLECFDEIDYVCLGEGEGPLLALADALESGDSSPKIARLLSRDAAGVSPGPGVCDLINYAQAPEPDIDEYFDHGLLGPPGSPGHVKLCINTARGCAWGRCTFCIEGIRRGEGYRMRTPAQIVEEIGRLSRRAGSADIVFTDPDMSNRGDVFEAIAECPHDFRLEAEVSGLVDLDGVLAMERAGMRSIQIGIETFSPAILKRFAKGVKLFHYVELMRYCRILGLELTYNIIVGAPFERAQDLEEAERNMRKLWFLPPPVLSEFVVSIGSPIYSNADRFNIAALSPLPETACFPEPVPEKLGPLLSFHAGLEYERKVAADPPLDHSGMVDAVERWWRYAEAGASCRALLGPGFADIEYLVGDTSRHLRIDDPVQLAAMQACRTFARSFEALEAAVAAAGLDAALTETAISELETEDVVFVSDGMCLLLPLISRERLLQDAAREREQAVLAVRTAAE